MFNWCWLIRRQQWWPKQQPSSSADAQNILIDYLHYNKYCYVLVLVLMDHNMIFGYGYCRWQNWRWHQHVPPLLAILMAMAVRRCNRKRIAQCSMSRATPEATGRHHWATTRSVPPQRLPGQQQTKRWRKNVPKRPAILMAAAVCRYNTARNARQRRFRALLDATKCHHRASIAVDSCNWSSLPQFFLSIFIVNLYKKVAGWR
jgi:hypothetical protein